MEAQFRLTFPFIHEGKYGKKNGRHEPNMCSYVTNIIPFNATFFSCLPIASHIYHREPLAPITLIYNLATLRDSVVKLSGKLECCMLFLCYTRDSTRERNSGRTENTMLHRSVWSMRWRGIVYWCAVQRSSMRWGRKKCNAPTQLPWYYYRTLKNSGKVSLFGKCAKNVFRYSSRELFGRILLKQVKECN